MPLEQLKTYSGCNPQPDDFDQYWDHAFIEMNGIDPDVELVLAEFQVDFADCYQMYFTGVKGARIHAKFARPKHISGKHPAVLKFHGYTGSSGSWFDLLPYAAAGFVVAALDVRG